MATVDVGSESYTTYASLDEADAYLGGASHIGLWAAASDDVKGRALVTATRILDRQRWPSDYDTFEKRLAVPNIVNASIELALALVNGDGVQVDANTSQKIASLRAGSVAITYFRGAEGSIRRFPLIVEELLWGYLIIAGTGIGVRSFGTCGESITNDPLGYSGPI